MKVEVPELKRCCCCLPLRYGLLVWAYIKLIITFIIGILIARILFIFTWISLMYGGAAIFEVTVGFFVMLLIFLDISLTIVFLVGGHKKNIKLLRVYYIYSIVLLCILSLCIVGTTILDIYTDGIYNAELQHGIVSFSFLVHTKIITALIHIASQVYFILLIRSEIIKLRNNCNFRFMNTASEALCTMENGNKHLEKENNDYGNGNNDNENRTIDQEKETDSQTNGSQLENSKTIIN